MHVGITFVSSHHTQITQQSSASSNVVETSTTEDNTLSWHSNPTTCLKLDNKCVLSMSASLDAMSASAILPLWSDCPLHPSSMGRRTHHVAGTNAPSTKNCFRDALCCSSRVAVTAHALPISSETLREEVVRDTYTHKCRCARELKKLTATQNRTINFQFIVAREADSARHDRVFSPSYETKTCGNDFK